MPTITVPAEGVACGEGVFLNATPLPAATYPPSFDITIDNTHATVAADGSWRPIDLKMPMPDNFDERWIHDMDDELVVTAGSQTGTAVIGETFGTEYARLHVRGIDVPANGHLTGVTVSRGSAPSTPRYALATDGFTQFTGANELYLHAGDSVVQIPLANWTQVESGPGRHKWDGWVFDETERIYWRVRAYTWPGVDRTDFTVVAVWHDQQTTVHRKAIPRLEVSTPLATHHAPRFEFGSERQMEAERTVTVDSSVRRAVQLAPAVTIGDAQSVRAKFSTLPFAADAAELADFSAGYWRPCKAVCDPTVWAGRIGPHRYIDGHDGFWAVSEQWGDGGATLRDHVWTDVDSRRGFMAELASKANQPFYSRPRRAGFAASDSSGEQPNFGNSQLPLILGIRNGNPRSLWDYAFSGLWETSMRPFNYVFWTKDINGDPVAPTGRWITAGDYPTGHTRGALVLNEEQRLQHQVTANRPGFYEAFGKPDAPEWAELFYAPRDALGGVAGFKMSHHEVSMIGALAILDDIDDHWTDFMHLTAACMVYQRGWDESDINFGRAGQYREGRTEIASAWAWEVVDASTRSLMLTHWIGRYERDNDTYREFWDHVKHGHELESWYRECATNQGVLISDYHPEWQFSRGGPGYAMIARLVRRFGGRGHLAQFVARQARYHLEKGWYWDQASQRWHPIYAHTYRGRFRLTDDPNIPSCYQVNFVGWADEEDYGKAPEDADYLDPERVKLNAAPPLGEKTYINLYWWLGAVQEAERFVESELGDSELAARARAIAQDIVQAGIPAFDSRLDLERVTASRLLFENHAAGDIPTPSADQSFVIPAEGITTGEPDITVDIPQAIVLTVPAEGLSVGDAADTHADLTQPAPVAPIIIEVPAEGISAGEPGESLPRRQDIPVDLGESTGQLEGVGVGEPALVVTLGNAQAVIVPAEGVATGEPDLVARVAPKVIVPAEGVSVGEPGIGSVPPRVIVPVEGVSVGASGLTMPGRRAPTYQEVKGVWRPEQVAQGGWDVARTDQGITIVAGDDEQIRVEVREDDGSLIDCSNASSAEFVITLPATPYKAEQEILRRTMVDGIDVSTGVPIVELGDTSELEATEAIYALRIALGGKSQTVVRSSVRIMANAIPAGEEGA